MPASDEQRRSFFQRLGSLLAAQAPAPAVPNSTLAFFVEDFLMGLEEQNVRLDPDDAAALDRHAKTLLKTLQRHSAWLPILTLEVRYQQRVISILTDLTPTHPLEETLTDLEGTIYSVTLPPTLKQAKEETERLADAVQRYLQVRQVLALDGVVARSAVEAQAELCAKTFQSAFPAEDLPRFARLDAASKKKHLAALHLIHTGITVFKGELDGRKAARVIPTWSPAPQDTLPLLEAFSEAPYASLLTDLVAVIQDIEARDCNEMDFNDQIELKLTWQKFIQVKNLLDAEFAGLLTLRNRANAEVERLVRAAQKPTQTLKNVIFPIFEALGDTYLHMLGARRKIGKLLDFVGEFRANAATRLQALPLMTPPTRPTSLKDLEALTKHPRFRWVPYDSPEVARVRLAYNGMCLVSLVCDGTLLYGNPAEAILHDTVRGLHLSFFSAEKAAEFLKDPDLVYDHARQALTDYKMLMFLMDFEALQRYQLFIETVGEECRTESLRCFNVGLQTPTHFAESLVDHTYFWNEWDLRRMAIKMANIRNKKTIGSQTGNSYFKVNNETQIWPLRDQGTMTESEKGTNPVWPRNYIVGLRSVDTK